MYSDSNKTNESLLGGPTPIDPDGVATLQASAPSEELIAVVAGTFQALGDPTRLKMLYALSKRSCCVRDLAILVEVSESAVSHHLRLLKDRKLVQSRREGTTIYYALANRHLAVVFGEQNIMQIMCIRIFLTIPTKLIKSFHRHSFFCEIT